MRITLNLDDDIAALLQSLARHPDRSLDLVIHETLRAGLARPENSMRAPAFRVEPMSLGTSITGSQDDCISAKLEATEGPMHR